MVAGENGCSSVAAVCFKPEVALGFATVFVVCTFSSMRLETVVPCKQASQSNQTLIRNGSLSWSVAGRVGPGLTLHKTSAARAFEVRNGLWTFNVKCLPFILTARFFFIFCWVRCWGTYAYWRCIYLFYFFTLYTVTVPLCSHCGKKEQSWKRFAYSWR